MQAFSRPRTVLHACMHTCMTRDFLRNPLGGIGGVRGRTKTRCADFCNPHALYRFRIGNLDISALRWMGPSIATVPRYVSAQRKILQLRGMPNLFQNTPQQIVRRRREDQTLGIQQPSWCP